MNNIRNNKLATFAVCSFCVFALSTDLYARLPKASSRHFYDRSSSLGQQVTEDEPLADKDRGVIIEEGGSPVDDETRQLMEERNRILNTMKKNTEAEQQQKMEAEKRRKQYKQEIERENQELEGKQKLIEENRKLKQKMGEDKKRILEEQNAAYKQEIEERRATTEKLSLKKAKLIEEKKQGLEEENRRAEETRKLEEENRRLRQAMKEISGPASGFSLSSRNTSTEVPTSAVPTSTPTSLSQQRSPMSAHLDDEVSPAEQTIEVEQQKNGVAKNQEMKKAEYISRIRKRMREIEKESKKNR